MTDLKYEFCDAIEDNNLEKVKTFIDNGADVNAKTGEIEIQTLPLIWAIRGKSFDVAKLLIKHGANVNAKNNDSSSILHAAANYNTIDIAKLLIDNGADVNAVNRVNTTPLHYAAENDSYDMAKLLIENGANIYAKDCLGNSPGMIARRHILTNWKVYKLLLEIDNNLTNKQKENND